MKKITVVCDYYLPGVKAGGPIVSVSNLIDLLSKEFEVVVITRDRDAGDLEPYAGVELNALNEYRGYKIFYISSFFGIVKSFRYLNVSCLYLNSFFSKFSLVYLFISLFTKARRVISPRGEFGSGALVIKSFKKKAFIAVYNYLGLHRSSVFLATSDSEAKDIALSINVKPLVLANITSQDSASVNLIDKTPGDARFIYLSRITQKKNLHLALLALKNIPVDSSVTYDIYGPIEDLAYWTKCLQIVDTLPSNIEFCYRGVLSHDAIIATLNKYHSLLLPTANENYGHAIVEAMLNGVVPVISDQTPWRNLEKNLAGWDVDLANLDNLSLAINSLIMSESARYRIYSKGANDYISKALDIPSLLNDYRNIFSN